jgi:hypothetical protein
VVVHIASSGVINTNGFNATLNGPLIVHSNFGQSKTGTGILTLTQPGYANTSGGNYPFFTVSGGELRASNAVGSAVGAMPLTVNSGAVVSGSRHGG